MFKIFFDKIFSLVLIVLLTPFLVIIILAIKMTTPGPIFHFSKRIGRFNKEFTMFKFRTMRTNTPQVATHLLSNPQEFITPIGVILRKYSLDELPQLINILIGDMSFVGPRPALFNQYDLIEKRTQLNIHELRPGLTGLAQINGRDDLSIDEKIQWDSRYSHERKNFGIFLDIWIILKTFFISFFYYGKGIRH